MAINSDIDYVMKLSIDELSELFEEVKEINRERDKNRRK